MDSISNTLLFLYRGTPFHGEWITACLDGAWQELLGNRVAKACRPVALHGVELVIEVLDTAWLPALASMKPDLLQRIQAKTAGEVQRISFVPRQTA
jgi:predicted nucleic acid-binding Zn ribbon protein